MTSLRERFHAGRVIFIGNRAFNMMEECWRQVDEGMLALSIYDPLGRLRLEFVEYLRTKRLLLTDRYDDG